MRFKQTCKFQYVVSWHGQRRRVVWTNDDGGVRLPLYGRVCERLYIQLERVRIKRKAIESVRFDNLLIFVEGGRGDRNALFDLVA